MVGRSPVPLTMTVGMGGGGPLPDVADDGGAEARGGMSIRGLDLSALTLACEMIGAGRPVAVVTVDAGITGR